METARRFLEEAMKNETMAQKLREASTKEDLLNIAGAHGYDLSDGDLLALGHLIMSHARKQANEVLSEEDLLKITGGMGADSPPDPQGTEDFFSDVFKLLFSSSDKPINHP